MKVYIHTDIEGVAGWVFYAHANSQTLQNYHHTQRMNRLLTHEVVAASQAAIDGGADEVWINDAHGSCYNILFEQLPKPCRIIHGRPGFFDAWLAAFDSSVDALVCIGQHAMAGTAHAVCPHSLWHVNEDSIRLSETTMAAALAGSFGVPMVCVSGDDKICAEVKERIPSAETVVVKWSLAAQNARSMTPQAAQEAIYQGVMAGLKRRDTIPAFTISGPYRLNISDRDPKVKLLRADIEGTDFWETVHRALNAAGTNHYGEDPIDDRSFRWP